MKIRILKSLILFLSLTMVQVTNGQSQKIKFGKPSEQDLLMTTYPQDKDAEAVYLNEINKIDYSFNKSGLSLIYEREFRVKILKESGRDLANYGIPYLKKRAAQATSSELKTCAINMQNGKAVVTELTEENVRVGTIIDVKFSSKSEMSADFPSIDIQHTIPVRYGYFSINMPKFIEFNIYSRGFVPMNMVIEEMELPVPGYSDLLYSISKGVIEQENIPALKNTDHIYCRNDYLSGFDYEVYGIYLDDIMEKDLATSWPDFCKSLDKNLRFGGAMKEKCLLTDEVSELRNTQLTDFEKISRLNRAVQSKVTWNGQHQLFCSEKGIKNVLDEGIGNSADMNFILMGALKELGYAVYPVLLNPRHMGHPSLQNPVADRINAFILLVKGQNAANYYVDASDENAFVNTIPPLLLNQNAHYFSTTATPSPVNLSDIGKHQKTMHIDYTIADDGSLAKGVAKFKYNNLMSYDNNVKHSKFDSEEDYISLIKQEQELVALTNFNRSVSETAAIAEEYRFEKALNITDNTISLNPFLSMLDISQCFNEQDRKLPVEFDFPNYSYHLIANIIIPDGWTVDELPKSSIMNFGSDDITLSLVYNMENNRIVVQIRHNINRMIFLGDEYPNLIEYFSKQKELLEQKIIIKKTK